MGMGTVFVVLILISLIISCFKVIPYLQNKKANAGAKKDVADPVVEQIEQREETSQLTDDLELVAVISAAIAAAEGTSADAAGNNGTEAANFQALYAGIQVRHALA